MSQTQKKTIGLIFIHSNISECQMLVKPIPKKGKKSQIVKYFFNALMCDASVCLVAAMIVMPCL